MDLEVGAAVLAGRSDRPDEGGPGNLFAPGTRNGPTGSYGRFAFSASTYTRSLEYHPARRRAVVGALAAGALAVIRNR